jgi:hypothetical protein
MAAQSATHQRRALELLAVSAKQGCTEAFLLAHGFTLDLLTDRCRVKETPGAVPEAFQGDTMKRHLGIKVP